jgi:ribosomal protein RSM22 (predicted rRNA methylase)
MMCDMAKAIVGERRGAGIGPTMEAGLFFRLSNPAQTELTYDLVTSCHTLLELPSAEARLTAIDSLWRRTADYLIIMEEGTNAGFQVISESRDYLLQLTRAEHETEQENEESSGHIFAPVSGSNGCHGKYVYTCVARYLSKCGDSS